MVKEKKRTFISETSDREFPPVILKKEEVHLQWFNDEKPVSK